MDDRRIPSTNTRTLVLVGKVGSGKSATSNSILGRETFMSELGLTGVTTTCQMKCTTRDGRTVNVIDTPGMFAPSVGSEEIAKERVNCLDLANNRIHAVILVVSIATRFSEEEETTLDWLQQFFGERIVDYMILVFTGVDCLKPGKSFWDYQSSVPPPLKTIIQTCQGRVVPFNNKTTDRNKKEEQLKHLLHYVDYVVEKNGGKPYSCDIPLDTKVETRLELKKELVREQRAREKAKDGPGDEHDPDCCCTIL